MRRHNTLHNEIGDIELQLLEESIIWANFLFVTSSIILGISNLLVDSGLQN
ncbi:3310_t:CDS:2 [Funneliformis geosporum]|uniref:3310_t:CDS:1 n=1 Tax=Funneliformis geosporum TaxID=1117311 RepID=A0A9W4SB20_9GLOM|nr:3310_t:CDS:2 [Funneliformis geosporum]